MVMSTGMAPVESTIRKRAPLVTGSMGGVPGTEEKKLEKLSLSSLVGARSSVRVSLAFDGTVGTKLVQGSQASPSRSPSLLSCEVLAMGSQLAMASHTVSLSVSGAPGQHPGEPTHVPSAQTSPVEHTSPSSHGLVLGTCVQALVA